MISLILAIIALCLSCMSLASCIFIYLKDKKEINILHEELNVEVKTLDTEIHNSTESEYKAQPKDENKPALVIGPNNGNSSGIKIDTAGAAPGNSGLSISHVRPRKEFTTKRLHIK